MRAKTASSEPVPLISMLLAGSKFGKTEPVKVTTDTGASSTVVSAQTAQLLFLQIDQTRMVHLEDAQGNKLHVSGIACVYGCLEMAQEVWGSFEVIVSPALSTGVLLGHVEQKYYGLIPEQWPYMCLHNYQLNPKRDRVNTEVSHKIQSVPFQTNRTQRDRQGRFETSMENFPAEICQAITQTF